MAKLKVKIKAEGNEAKQLLNGLDLPVPPPAPPNFVSPDDSYVLGKSPSPAKRGKERLEPSGQDPAGNQPTDIHSYPTTAQYIAHAFPVPSDNQPGTSLAAREVKPVKRVLTEAENVRLRNNRARDLRTNLGKSRPMSPVADE